MVLCTVFWFWLSCQYLPSDWLERLLWGSLIVVRRSSPESPGRRMRMIFLVYCIASLFYYVGSCPYMIYYPTVMARYSLFVLKVPLNPKQTNKLGFIRCSNLPAQREFSKHMVQTASSISWLNSDVTNSMFLFAHFVEQRWLKRYALWQYLRILAFIRKCCRMLFINHVFALSGAVWKMFSGHLGKHRPIACYCQADIRC